ncbi:murein transglycosylase A [Oleidesulfovibrio alaskensis]|jgi:membrane-bound lytic murein transglycosylase A|uniref:murein transglycosylase A n=1 Tax=Oleidesulfovibrio alaskensis TaxID=58180 RepID=UPI001F43C8CF|nr:murein transglycosylase A [Oleidesulfovibrio alaskensis]
MFVEMRVGRPMAPRLRLLLLAACCTVLLAAGGCAVTTEQVPVFREVPQDEARDLTRSLDPRRQGLDSWLALRPALERSLEYVRRRPAQDAALDKYGRRVTWDQLRSSLELFVSLLPQLDSRPELLARHFTFLRLEPGPLFTGYYEPYIHASPVRSAAYPFPLYGKPQDLKTVRLEAFHPRWKGQVLTYRVENGEVVPYHDRETIDSGGALEGKGLEIAWVQDPADIFFLQVQGSGRLIMPDGTEKHVLYAGKNGREYVSLGRVMKERGLLPADGISMQSIRAYLAAHPEKERELLNTNPSYVFFRLSDDGPYGSINQVLTPWVSLATDRATLPLGSAMLFSVPRPLPATVQQHGTDGRAYAEQPFTGIGLAQDTGGAIKEHRIDLFSGSGELAEFVAGHLAARGSVYLLLPRQTAP